MFSTCRATPVGGIALALLSNNVQRRQL